ncbi:MAG: CPBP family intramembrane glutamic endopeptidase [Sandaracinus sp.]
MQRLGLAISALALVLLAALLAISTARVRGLMDRELDRAGEPAALVAGAPNVLVEADLVAGDDVTFELCSSEGMSPERWTDAVVLAVEAGDGAPRDVVLEERVGASMLGMARRNTHGACVDFARAGPLQIGGHYVVVARDVAPSLVGAPARARILAESPLVPGDRNAVLAVLAVALLFVIGLALRAPSPLAHALLPAWPVGRAAALAGALGVVGIALAWVYPWIALSTRAIATGLALTAAALAGVGLRRGRAEALAVLGVTAVIEGSFTISLLSSAGAAAGLVSGLTLAFCEIAVAVALAGMIVDRGAIGSLLGLERPAHRVVALLGLGTAPFLGVILRILATRALQIVPSTGEAPIEAYVSWPSGLLSFAVLSAVAPIGEEIFFRGLVYGALYGPGGRARAALAFVGAWGLFVVAHAPQTWGSWGGLLAVAIAGLGFTAVRALTGSVLVSSIAHLVYNGLLVAMALASAA